MILVIRHSNHKNHFCLRKCHLQRFCQSPGRFLRMCWKCLLLSYYPLTKRLTITTLENRCKTLFYPWLCKTYIDICTNNKNIKIQPPSSSTVAPDTPSNLASSEDNIWVLPCKNALSRPARIAPLDKLHPGI